MKKIFCDAGCAQEFIILKLVTVPVRDDIERVGFDCPHCGHKYTAFYTNKKIKALQEQQKVLLKQSDPRGRPQGQVKGILRRIEATKQQIKAEMDKLRKEVEVG